MAVLVNSSNSSDFYQKISTIFGEKVSKNGNEWHLDIGINENWWYFESSCETRENNLDQEGSADFKGLGRQKKDPWAINNHRLRPIS